LKKTKKQTKENQSTILVSLLYYPVYTLGPGVRVGLWLQGCSIHCKNCISKHTWEFSKKFSTNIKKLASKINSFKTKKLTISGGEPLDQIDSLLKLLQLVRNTKTDILLYTGYILEKFIEKNKQKWEILKKLVDVIIDGPFIWNRETDYIWKGSENQKMIILNENLMETYLQYKKQKKNKNLQLIYYKDQIFIAGIPYQKDYEKLISIPQNPTVIVNRKNDSINDIA
jgi:anaerobic ribonucleoside-triphosphate reductase activating protein